MSISRYNETLVLKNEAEEYTYSDIFKKRGVSSIDQYLTPELKYPSPQEMEEELILETEVWTVGSKYFLLADKYYNNPQYWWIIAWFNMSPLETDFQPGDVVTIPTPVEAILSSFGLL